MVNRATMKEWGRLLMPDLHSLLRLLDSNLTFAVFLFSWGVFCTYTGKAKAPYSPAVYRAQEPILFWYTVGIYYLGGVIFIGRFLYEVHAPSK
jgi:hypothetical protein